MAMDLTHGTVSFGAGLIAGAMNSVAGGGTLLTFPTLIWLGLNSRDRERHLQHRRRVARSVERNVRYYRRVNWSTLRTGAFSTWQFPA